MQLYQEKKLPVESNCLVQNVEYEATISDLPNYQSQTCPTIKRRSTLDCAKVPSKNGLQTTSRHSTTKDTRTVLHCLQSSGK